MRPLTLITHDDLDGYGVSTCVREVHPSAKILHVPGPDEVGGPALQACERLARAEDAEDLVVADLRIAPAHALFVDRFARLNAARPPAERHRLLILDHHVGTLETLRGYADGGDPHLTVVVDQTRCATRLMVDHLDHLGAGSPPRRLELERLAALVETVDLWRKADPRFELGLVLADTLAQHVSAYIPYGHAQHDRFVSEILLGLTELVYTGQTPRDLEVAVPSLRHAVIERIAGVPGTGRSRARLSQIVADDPGLLHAITCEFGIVRIGYGLNPDLFQDLADRTLQDGRAALVVGIDPDGTIALRSRGGQAGRVAARCAGGGHPDAAGGRLPSDRRVSRSEAVVQFCEILGLRADSETSVVITLSEDAVTHDILDDGLPIRMRGTITGRRSIDALLMPDGRSREHTYAALEGLTAGSRVRLTGRWQTVDMRTSASLRDLEFQARSYVVESGPHAGPRR